METNGSLHSSQQPVSLSCLAVVTQGTRSSPCSQKPGSDCYPEGVRVTTSPNPNLLTSILISSLQICLSTVVLSERHLHTTQVTAHLNCLLTAGDGLTTSSVHWLHCSYIQLVSTVRQLPSLRKLLANFQEQKLCAIVKHRTKKHETS
jgi:hypothetical protein